MTRPARFRLIVWGCTLATAAGVMGVAHAASLGGISSGTVAAWTHPADPLASDTNPPTIVASASPPPNAFGWNNTPVTVTFTCDDPETGIASCTDPVLLSTEGAGQIVTGEAVDHAGNTAAASITSNIDLTGPVVEFVGLVGGGLPIDLNVGCTASDELSGVLGTCVVTIVPSLDLGLFDLTATATDHAGNVTVVTMEGLAVVGGLPALSEPTAVPEAVPNGG